MPIFSDLGHRMKFYESCHNGVNLMPLIPVIIRLDGRAFHSFTKGFDKPFDMELINLMTQTTAFLVKETNANMGYTQSDEITLILYSDSVNTQIYFDGRIQKINSVLASVCSTYFNLKAPELMSGSKIKDKQPVFDCRCFNVPTQQEVINYLIWREQDAVRNSIQMAGQASFSHTELMNKNCNEIQEMLFNRKGINWNNFPDSCKRGTYVQKRTRIKMLTVDETAKLPEKHHARTNPQLSVERAEVVVMPTPPITKVINPIDFVFHEWLPVPGVEPLSPWSTTKQ